MAGTCITGALHTLDMIERSFYIPRTHTQSHSSVPLCRDLSQRRRPAISDLFLSAPVRAFSPRSATDYPLQQEVLAKRDLYVAWQGSPPIGQPRPPSRVAGGRPNAARDALGVRARTHRKQTLGGPLRAAGTQEDEE